MQRIKISTLMRLPIISLDGHRLETPHDWRTMLAKVSSEPGFADLVDDVIKNGIKNPISLSWADDEDGYGKAVYLNNGHHRMAAGILVVRTYLPVTWGWTPDQDRPVPVRVGSTYEEPRDFNMGVWHEGRYVRSEHLAAQRLKSQRDSKWIAKTIRSRYGAK